MRLQSLLPQLFSLSWIHESEVNDVCLCVRKYEDTVYLPQMVVVVSSSYVYFMYIIYYTKAKCMCYPKF